MVWKTSLSHRGLGGVAATDEFVIVGDRDVDDLFDVFRCFDARDGTLRWTVEYPAPGKLDYGNSPRATPLIDGDRVYLLGAFGDLNCVRITDGELIWIKNLRLEFGASYKLIWGACSSPLLADGKLIVNPGAETASVVAIDPETGETLWQTPGDRAGYGSFVAATVKGIRQIVGYDRNSLGGWDPATGERLWTLVPPVEGDFNVPTPIVVEDRLLVATENNGTRLYAFDEDGTILPEPIMATDELSPDTSTPVLVGGRLYCVSGGLYCIDLKNEMKLLWLQEDKVFGDYAAIFGGERHLLVVGAGGCLVLLDATSESYREISRMRVLESNSNVYSHPAIVGRRLFIRGASSLSCIDLGMSRP